MLDGDRVRPETIAELLASAAAALADSSETAQLDAEVLLCHCLDKPRAFLRAWPERSPDAEQTSKFHRLLEQRRQGVPVAYLTGHREFWSREFLVGPEVLIPRPDTELLVELSLDLLPSDRPCRVIDLGTGSGILAITLAVERPLAHVVGLDINRAALETAQRNAGRLQVANVNFAVSNWFADIAESDFDLVVSNPPYIAADDPHLRQGDVRFEPANALVSAENGLKDIRLIAEQARSRLKPHGQLLLEHGYNQATAVQTILTALGYRHVATHHDLANNPRVTRGVWNP
ncbi:peptide chain release factor N(5)-glutamine methyltransferase [Methylomonas koyamae]|uniref:peptide chain release factor N(5)-glutamine methyltransferase n=1 Tax=Methylomonas koyamae TaxID=702114 RepID=UPI00112EAE59|nr:peptide chain release factor N(5)-glutamine methyltransferase [Methylomonas koyamae]TPQ29204.1 peptide chain release factor N(5)-glutamine methyltransferase [Methylomonas koyamae]